MKDKNEVIRCECCGQILTNYKTTLSHRNVIWLASLSFLSKKANNTDNYVHYADVAEFVKDKFGFVVSSYSMMSGMPWNLIEPAVKTEKYNSNGYWRLSETGRAFLYGEIKLPSIGHFNHDGCYDSTDEKYVSELIKCTFQELINQYKSF